MREQQGSACPALCHCLLLTTSHADYTKSVIDLRPGDLVGEGGSLGDRSKSVPGLNTEMVRPSECLEMAASWRSWVSGWLCPTAPHTGGLSISLQEEEEEDIDNLVEIHRQRVARGSMRSGTSSVSPRTMAVPCSTTGRSGGEGQS